MPTRYSAKESKKIYGNNDTINWEGWIMENTKILISNTQTKEIVTQFYLSSLTDGVGALFYTWPTLFTLFVPFLQCWCQTTTYGSWLS